MKNKHYLWAILLLVMVNFAVLAGVRQNRSADVDAALILTERELRPHRNNAFNRNREDSGVSLRLRTNEFVAADWFDQAKLEELGFNCDIEPGDKKAYRYYRRQPSRKAFVVLEYEGEAWQKFRNGLEEELAGLDEEAAREDADPQRLKNRRQEIERKLNNASRLFAVDAGKDPQKLRKRYDDRSSYIITPAEVRMRFNYYKRRDDKKEQLTGTIRKILTRIVHVSLDQREVLDFLQSREGRERYKSGSGYGNYNPPRYKVLLQYGSRYEPWIGRIELLEAKPSGSEG